MIPFIIAAVGAYLIADSVKDSKKFAKGGELDNKKVLRYRNKLVQLNIGKNLTALDFAISLIDMILDGKLEIYGEKLPIEKNEDYKKVLRYRNKLVQFNVGKDEPALDFSIGLIDLFLDGQIVKTEKFYDGRKFANGGMTDNEYEGMYDVTVVAKELEKDGGGKVTFNRKIYAKSYTQAQEIAQRDWDNEMRTSDLSLLYIKAKKTDDMAKGGKIGVDKASSGFRKKFVWVKEQNGVATEILQQKSFEEDFSEISGNRRFKLVVDDKGMKVFRDDSGWSITYRLKPIFAYGGQLELDFEPEEEVDESMLKAMRYVQLQNMANEQIEMFGEIEDETAKQIEDLGDSLNSYEVELVMEMYGKKKFAGGGEMDKKMYVVEIYSIDDDESEDDDLDLEKYTLRVNAYNDLDAIYSAECLFSEEYGALPVFSAKVVKSYDMGGNIDAEGDVKLSSYNPKIHDEEIKVTYFSTTEAEVEFCLYYADDSEIKYVLDFDVEKRGNEYNWSLDKVYKLKGEDRMLVPKEEIKAVDNNDFITKAVDQKISDEIDMYENEEEFIELDDES